MAQVGFTDNNLGFFQSPIILGQQGPEGPQGSPSTIPGPQGIQGVQGPPGEGSQTILLYDAVSSPASTKLAWETLKTYTTSNALGIGEEVIYEYYTKNVLGLDGNIRLRISDGTTTINTITLPFAQAQEFTIELSLKRSLVGYIYTIKRIGSVSLFSLVGQVADNFSAAFTSLDETIAPTVSFQVFINDISTVLASQFSVQFQLIKFFKLNVGTGSPIGVQTVTGLDTDNTDPLNPVVQISVDGTTITGAGTTLSPLIAEKQLTSQNTIIVSSVNTGNPSADAIANGVLLKAAITAADALNIGTRSATNRVAVLLTGGTYDADGTGFTLPSFIDIVGISSSAANTILTNSTGAYTIIAPLNVDYGLYNIDLRAGTTAAVGDNAEQGQFHRWDNVLISGNCTTGLIDLIGDFKRIIGSNAVDFANVTGDIGGSFDVKIGDVVNVFTTTSGDISGDIIAEIGDVSAAAFRIQVAGNITANAKVSMGNAQNSFAIFGTGDINGEIECKVLDSTGSLFIVLTGNINGSIKLKAGTVNFCFFVNSGGIDANIDSQIVASTNHYFRTGNGNIFGNIKAIAGSASSAFRIFGGTGSIDGDIEFKVGDAADIFVSASDISGKIKIETGTISGSCFTISVGGVLDAEIYDSFVYAIDESIAGLLRNSTVQARAIFATDTSRIERCKILGDNGTNSIIGTTTTAQIIYTATKEPIAAGVTGLLSNNFNNTALI